MWTIAVESSRQIAIITQNPILFLAHTSFKKFSIKLRNAYYLSFFGSAAKHVIDTQKLKGTLPTARTTSTINFKYRLL